MVTREQKAIADLRRRVGMLVRRQDWLELELSRLRWPEAKREALTGAERARRLRDRRRAAKEPTWITTPT